MHIGSNQVVQFVENTVDDFDQQMALVRSGCTAGDRDVRPVLDDITDAIVSKRPYTRYNPMEPHWWIRMQLMTHLPAALSDRLYF